MQGRVLSVTAGKVRKMTMPEGVRVDHRHANWSSGIFKSAVQGPVRVGEKGMEGDEQADLNFHGGPDNVVLAYAAGHYPVWRKELGVADLPFGSFGENVTVDGDFSDETVCIGDIWRIGEEDAGVVLQVTQPRQPCYKLARRLEQPHIVKMVRDRGWGGWYSRVLHAGSIEAGMAATLIERRHPQWTCVAAAMAMYGRKQDRERAAALAALPELSARWKRELLEKETS